MAKRAAHVDSVIQPSNSRGQLGNYFFFYGRDTSLQTEMILLQTLWATFRGLGFCSSSKEPRRQALCEAIALCPRHAAVREEVPSV